MSASGQGKLRVALAGAGAISHYHLIAWAHEKRAEVVAICDPDTARARSRAAEGRGARVYPSLKDALADGGIDAVDIASPRATHAGLVELAVDAGMPVLCQKPLARTLAEAETLAASVAGRARVMVHENWRFRPWYRRIRQWLEDGRLGAVEQVDMAMLSSGMLPDETGARPLLVRQPYMLTEPRLMIADVLIHHLDVLRWLFGPLRVLDARMTNTLPGIVVGETLAVIFLETGTHAPVTLRGSMVAAGEPVRTEDRLAAMGAAAAVRLAGTSLSLTGVVPLSESFDFAASYQESFDATVRHFVDCLAGGRPFETEVADNLETLRLVEDAYHAAGAGPP
ncbi:MAG: Gfo/Idh/MocA family oxidoreductase [Rhizobiales bacterium]|nr:Gfo/Idh/MocA family oxidoreductase [Hyphomicrobiales bacterium]